MPTVRAFNVVGPPHQSGATNDHVFDADSHLMEVENWLPGYADPDIRKRLVPLGFDNGSGAGVKELMVDLPELWERQRGDEVPADVISGPKGWWAPGALDAMEWSRWRAPKPRRSIRQGAAAICSSKCASRTADAEMLRRRPRRVLRCRRRLRGHSVDALRVPFLQDVRPRQNRREERGSVTRPRVPNLRLPRRCPL